MKDIKSTAEIETAQEQAVGCDEQDTDAIPGGGVMTTNPYTDLADKTADLRGHAMRIQKIAVRLPDMDRAYRSIYWQKYQCLIDDIDRCCRGLRHLSVQHPHRCGTRPGPNAGVAAPPGSRQVDSMRHIMRLVRLSHGTPGNRGFEGNWVGAGLLAAAMIMVGLIAW